MTRRSLIKARAAYLRGEFLVRDEASMTRDVDDEEMSRRRQAGERAGAEWVARHRGLCGLY